MKQAALLMLVTCLAAAPVAVFFYTSESIEPDVRVSSNSISLGAMSIGESRPFGFKLINGTESYVETERIRTSCGCIVDLADKYSLNPGESCEIKAHFVSNEIKSGQKISKSILISFKNGNVPILVKIDAEILQGISYSSGPLEFVAGCLNPVEIEVRREFLDIDKFRLLSAMPDRNVTWMVKNITNDSCVIEGVPKSNRGVDNYAAPLLLKFLNNANRIETHAIPVVYRPSEHLVDLDPNSGFRVIPYSDQKVVVQEFSLISSKGELWQIVKASPSSNESLFTVEVRKDKASFQVSICASPSEKIVREDLLVTVTNGIDEVQLTCPVTVVVCR